MALRTGVGGSGPFTGCPRSLLLLSHKRSSLTGVQRRICTQSRDSGLFLVLHKIGC